MGAGRSEGGRHKIPWLIKLSIIHGDILLLLRDLAGYDTQYICCLLSQSIISHNCWQTELRPNGEGLQLRVRTTAESSRVNLWILAGEPVEWGPQSGAPNGLNQWGHGIAVHAVLLLQTLKEVFKKIKWHTLLMQNLDFQDYAVDVHFGSTATYLNFILLIYYLYSIFVQCSWSRYRGRNIR